MTARDKCPAHYNFSDLQPWDVIDAWGVDYYLGNVLKYICRAGLLALDTRFAREDMQVKLFDEDIV